MPQHSRQKVNLCEGGILPKKAGWDSGGFTFFCLIPPGGNYFLNFFSRREGSDNKKSTAATVPSRLFCKNPALAQVDFLAAML